MVADPNKGKRGAETGAYDDHPSGQQDNLDQHSVAPSESRFYGPPVAQRATDHGYDERNGDRASSTCRSRQHERSRSPDGRPPGRYGTGNRNGSIYPDHYSPTPKQQTTTRRRSPPSNTNRHESSNNANSTKKGVKSPIQSAPTQTPQSPDASASNANQPSNSANPSNSIGINMYKRRAGLGSRGANLGDALEVSNRRIEETTRRHRWAARGEEVMDQVKARVRDIERRIKRGRYVEDTKESARKRFFEDR